MKIGTTGRSIFVTLAIFASSFFEVAYGQSEQVPIKKEKYLEVFRQVLEPAKNNWRQKNFFLRSQTWEQSKSFCLIGKSDSSMSGYVEDTIADIAQAYDKKHSFTKVTNADSCPRDKHSVIILLGSNPGFSGFQKIFMTLVNNAPQEDYGNFGEEIAFTVPLHDVLRGSFIFLDDTIVDKHSGRDFRTSIWLETLLHALTGGRNILTNEIITMLGTDLSVDSYADLYEKNPRGLCQVDFIMLELVLNGYKDIKRRNFDDYYSYLEANFIELFQKAQSRQKALRRYIGDGRC